MKQKKISANIPAALLERACGASKLNQTEAIIAGLQELIALHQRQRIRSLKGKVHISFDADKKRQRTRL